MLFGLLHIVKQLGATVHFCQVDVLDIPSSSSCVHLHFGTKLAEQSENVEEKVEQTDVEEKYENRVPQDGD